jgi:hypothetical protein
MMLRFLLADAGLTIGKNLLSLAPALLPLLSCGLKRCAYSLKSGAPQPSYTQ